jgi:two-component sensor histidine kinase
MRLAVEGAGMATWELDLTTMEGPWSQNRFEILGYTPSANGRGSYDEWTARVHSDDFQRANAAAQKCLTDGIPFEIEYRILRADNNEERWLRSNGSLIRASAGHSPRFVGISFDITRQKRDEAHQQLLIDELNHRVKNTLGIVQGIAQQSFNKETSVLAITEAFEGRLAALSAVHNLLTTGLWQAISLADLIAASLMPLARETQIHAHGPQIMLEAKTAVTMALALHELATNALKYGALSCASGVIGINWTISVTRELTLEWIEQGGPSVTPPNTKGFGIRMIEQGLAAEFRGNVDILFDPNGLICRLTAQLPESDD